MLQVLHHVAASPTVSAAGLDARPDLLRHIQSFLVDLHELDPVKVLASTRPANADSRRLLEFLLSPEELGRRFSNYEINLMMRFVCETGRMDLIPVLENVMPSIECLRMDLLLQEAVAHGQIAVAEWLHQHDWWPVTAKAMYKAAFNGHLAMCDWVLDHAAMRHEPFSEEEAQQIELAAIYGGHLDVIDRICEKFPRECINTAVREGKIHVLEFLLTRFPQVACLQCLFGDAMAANQLELAQWLDTRRRNSTSDVATGVCSDSNMHQVVQEFLSVSETTPNDKQTPGSSPLFEGFAENGNIQAFHWLLERFPNVSFGSNLLWFAAHGGNLDLIKLLVTKGKLKVSCGDVCEAAGCGHVQAFKYLMPLCNPDDEKIINIWQHAADRASSEGAVEILKDLDSMGGWRPQNMDECASHGHVEAVKYLLELGVPFGAQALHEAVSNGHVEVVKLLFGYRDTKDTEVAPEVLLALAVSSNQLELVKYLFPLCKNGDHIAAVRDATLRRRFKLVRFMLAQDIALRDEDMEFLLSRAIQAGKIWMVQSLICQHRSSAHEENLKRMMLAMAGNGYLNVLRCIHESFPNLQLGSQAMDLAAGKGHMAIIKYLHSIGWKCSPKAMLFAAQRGHLEVVKFLYEHCREDSFSSEVLSTAGSHCQIEVVAYLHQVGETQECSKDLLRQAIQSRNMELVKFMLTNCQGHVDLQPFRKQLERDQPVLGEAFAAAFGTSAPAADAF